MSALLLCGRESAHRGHALLRQARVRVAQDRATRHTGGFETLTLTRGLSLSLSLSHFFETRSLTSFDNRHVCCHRSCMGRLSEFELKCFWCRAVVPPRRLRAMLSGDAEWPPARPRAAGFAQRLYSAEPLPRPQKRARKQSSSGKKPVATAVGARRTAERAECVDRAAQTCAKAQTLPSRADAASFAKAPPSLSQRIVTRVKVISNLDKRTTATTTTTTTTTERTLPPLRDERV